MEQDDLRLLLESTSEDNKDKGAQDAPPSPDVNDVDVDEEDLGKYLVTQLKNDVADKESMGWQEKREYDIKAYDGIKDPWLSEYPHHNASNYPVPITPIQVDTGVAILDERQWRDKNRACIVNGVGDEDIRNAKSLESILSWQIINDIARMRIEWKAHIRQALKLGTSYFKVIRTVKDGFKLAVETIPIERIYIPVDAKSPNIDDTDHVTQAIPLSANDLIQRVGWGVYKNLDQIGKGWGVGGAVTPERLAFIRQESTGIDIVTKVIRDNWWICETYLTYYPRTASGPGGPMANFMDPIEMIVWWAPNTGKICRKIKNTEGLRPFSDLSFYRNDGMAFGKSLPEKIRHIQEKANYTDKQVTDAGDKAMNPAGFYDSANGFDPNLSQRAPTGMYPTKNAASIVWEQINIAPLLERKSEIRELFLQAERVTGISDLQQGVNTGSTPTLGQDQLRAVATNVRNNDLIGELNYSYNNAVNLIYKYDDMYMPRETKVKVLGTQEFYSIDQLFKNQKGAQGNEGLQLQGNFDFSIANKSVEEDDKDKAARYTFADVILTDPLFGQDIGNRYRALDMKAVSANIRDLGEIVKKPKEAYILSPQEIIDRIMSGDKDVQPSVYIDPAEYEQAIMMFMRTGNFRESEPMIQMEFGKFLMLVKAIRIGKEAAFSNFSDQTRPIIAPPQPGQNGKAPAGVQ